jgi:hypothetical protein
MARHINNYVVLSKTTKKQSEKMLPLAKKRILAFLFTALVVAPMFFFMPAILHLNSSIVFAETIVDDDPFPGTCTIGGWDTRSCIANVAYAILVGVPRHILSFSGALFDTLIAFSLSSTIIKNQDFVNTGWVIMRDLSNTFFIFILLYIAISTILQTAGGQTKRLLATLVVVALFMNFSLYITKFVIDVGNVFALEFYTNMGVKTKAYVNLGTGAIGTDTTPLSLSQGIVDSLRLTSVDFQTGPGHLLQAIFLFFMVGIMYLILTFVMLTVAFLFLARVLAFLILMIISTLAFFIYIITTTRRKNRSRWSSELVAQSFFAPIFLFFLYLTILLTKLLIQKPGFLFQAGQIQDAILVNILLIFLQFFAVTTILLFGLKTAKSMSGAVGASMLSIGQKVTGTAVGAGLGASAVAYRQSIGWAASRAKEKYGADMEKSKFGRTQLAVLNTAASGSGDVRAIGGVNKLAGMGGVSLGAAGGKGGYEALVQQKRSEQSKKLDELLRNNPAGAAKYLASLQDSSLIYKKDVRGINPNSEVIAAMSKLSSEKRQELIANAKPGKEQDLLKQINTSLGEGLTDKQKKQDALGEARYKNTEAKETIESFEGIKDAGDRKKYIENLVVGDPITGVAGLDKEKRLALYKNMSAAQRTEAEAMNNQIFAGINKETDLTKEELSKVLEQDKKYKDTNRENTAKVAQEGRVTNLKTIVKDYAAGRKTDLAAMQEEARTLISEMNENEVAALENTYLVSSVVAPHITKGIVAKVEKGDKVKLTVGQKEEFYKNLNDHGSPETKEYLKNQNSAEPKSGARRRFQGGKDNKSKA